MQSTYDHMVLNFFTWLASSNLHSNSLVLTLSFPVSTAEKCFSRILTTFPGPKTLRAGKVGNRVRTARLCTQNLPRPFGMQLLLFLVNTSDNIFGQISKTFSAPHTTGAGSVQAKLKTEPGWLNFLSEKYPYCFGVVLIVSRLYIWKLSRSNFDDFSCPIHHLLAPTLSMWFDEVNKDRCLLKFLMDWIWTMLDQCLACDLMKTASWRIYWNQPGPKLFKWRLCANMKMVGWFGLGP